MYFLQRRRETASSKCFLHLHHPQAYKTHLMQLAPILLMIIKPMPNFPSLDDRLQARPTVDSIF